MKTEEILEKLDKMHVLEYTEFIENLDLTKEQFEILSDHKDDNVRWEIARHYNLPKYLKYKLAEDEDENVKLNIAYRSDLPEDLIYKLAASENMEMKLGISRQPSLPKNLMYKWAEDSYYELRENIAQHPKLPDDLLYKLSEDKIDDVRLMIAWRQTLPDDLIYKLSKDKACGIRLSIVTRHSNLSVELLILLGCDVDPRVHKEAFKKLKKLNSIKLEELIQGYDLVRTSEHVDREGIEKTFNYLISEFPELSKLARMYRILLVRSH